MSRQAISSELIIGTIAGLSQWFVVYRGASATVGDWFFFFLWRDIGLLRGSWVIAFAGAATATPCALALALIANHYLDGLKRDQAISPWHWAFWGTTAAAFVYPVYGFLRALSPDATLTTVGQFWAVASHIVVLSVCAGLSTWMCMARTDKSFWAGFVCFWSWCCVSFLLFVNLATEFL